MNYSKPGKPLSEHIFRTTIAGLYYIQNPYISDERGFFSSPVDIDELEQVLGYSFVARQVNHSRSRQSVLRGLHLNNWNKLVYLTQGKADCVFVDLRHNSVTYTQWVAFPLGGGPQYQYPGAFYVEEGIANSFLARMLTDYVYLVDRSWNAVGPRLDVSVNAFDPQLAIDWDLGCNEVTMSDRDRHAPFLYQTR